MPICPTSKFAFALAVLLSAPIFARPVAIETLSGLAQKAEILVVAEVTSVSKGVAVPSDKWGGPILEKQATLKILRGLNTADSSAVDLEQLTLQFPAISPAATPMENGPMFPELRVGQVALFPLKHVGANWQFISEEDVAMLMPAAARTLNFDATDARLLLFR